MLVLFDIIDTGWSTTKVWGNLLPLLASDAKVDLKVILGGNLECQRLKTHLQSKNISCARRFPWPDFRPARVRWKIEDMLTACHGWVHTPDIFHSSTVRIPTFGNWKKFVTIHDTIRELFPDEFGTTNRSIIRMRKNVVKRCDGILTISEYSKKCIVSIFNVDPDKVFVSYLSVNNLELLPYRLSVQPNRKLLTEPYLLYVGTRSGYKNFGVLANAMSSNSNLKQFTIVAIGGGELTNTETTLLKNLGILDKIQVFNDVSDEFLQGAYRKAFALVYPSRMEGYGLPIIEAQAAGCPVIASNTGPLPEVAGSGALFFDPDDYESLSLLINTVSNPAVRESLTRAGYMNLGRFSWEKSRDAVIRMYEV
jgi:glycosyltransferase involved in cell wall biosynthesis